MHPSYHQSNPIAQTLSYPACRYPTDVAQDLLAQLYTVVEQSKVHPAECRVSDATTRHADDVK